MAVTHDATGGNPGGAMKGTFSSQFFPIPQTDAFRLASGESGITAGQEAAYLGDYRAITAYPARLSWVFELKPEDVLPSDLVFRFSDGTSTFFLPFTEWVTNVGEWNRVYVPLDYSKGWLGGSYAAFGAAIENITSIEIQVSRNGIGEQSYLIDNFEIIDFSIPEPSTAGFLLLSGVAIAARRWMHREQRRNRRMEEG